MMVTHPRCLLRPVAAETREQHDEHAEEEQDHGSENGPHACGVVGGGAGGGIVRVDVVFDNLFDDCD